MRREEATGKCDGQGPDQGQPAGHPYLRAGAARPNNVSAGFVQRRMTKGCQAGIRLAEALADRNCIQDLLSAN